MTHEELIAKQQIEIEEYKQAVGVAQKYFHQIMISIICIGGPLNDNKKGYTPIQKKDFQEILDHAEFGLGELDELSLKETP